MQGHAVQSRPQAVSYVHQVSPAATAVEAPAPAGTRSTVYVGAKVKVMQVLTECPPPSDPRVFCC